MAPGIPADKQKATMGQLPAKPILPYQNSKSKVILYLWGSFRCEISGLINSLIISI